MQNKFVKAYMIFRVTTRLLFPCKLIYFAKYKSRVSRTIFSLIFCSHKSSPLKHFPFTFHKARYNANKVYINLNYEKITKPKY